MGASYPGGRERKRRLQLEQCASQTVATRHKGSEQSSDCFPFPRGENLTVLGRSPDFQAGLLDETPDFSPSPIEAEWLYKKSFPDYSGGTAPDLHRLPFYALGGTQNVYKISIAPEIDAQSDTVEPFKSIPVLPSRCMTIGSEGYDAHAFVKRGSCGDRSIHSYHCSGSLLKYSVLSKGHSLAVP